VQSSFDYGHLVGHDDEYVIGVGTHVGVEKQPRGCRDDRAINQHFLRPAAVAVGVYYMGFGFHAFRREAITELAKFAGANQAQRMAGHSKADMSLHYTQSDFGGTIDGRPRVPEANENRRYPDTSRHCRTVCQS